MTRPARQCHEFLGKELFIFADLDERQRGGFSFANIDFQYAVT